MAEITVIMPTLNVADYIRECLDSVIAQSFRDVEIMIIDAGSEDGTIGIIQDYEEKDARIQLYHSEKRSYGYQVNYGILHASGKYISIVETDDKILPGMFETLFRISEQTGADYVKGDYEDWIPLSDTLCWSRAVPTWGADRRYLYDRIIRTAEHPEAIMNDIYLWKGIYRKSFLLENNILLNETDGAAFQDTGFQIQTICFAKKAVYLNQPFYRYRRGNTEASICSPRGFSFLAKEYDYIINIMREHPQLYESIAPCLYARLFDQLAGRVRTMAASGQIWGESEPAIRDLYGKLKDAERKGLLDSSVFGIGKWLDLKLFLAKPQDYIFCQQAVYMAKRTVLMELTEFIRKQGEIVLYSRSRMAVFLYCLMRKRGMGQAVCFCDNNPKHWGTDYMGLPVLAVEEAACRFKEAGFIIAHANITQDMEQQLRSYGIRKENIFLFHMENDLLLLNMR